MENKLPHTQHCTWLFCGFRTFVGSFIGFLVVDLLVVVLLVVVVLFLVVVVFLVERIVVLCVVVNLTGHETWLHLLRSLVPPLHLLPPPVASVLTLLTLTCSPPPHDREHSLHSPYCDQTQFLPVKLRIIIEKHYQHLLFGLGDLVVVVSMKT